MNNQKPVWIIRIFQSVPLQERINFARHLSVATKSGLPLIEALKLIRTQASSKSLGRIIDDITRDIENGQFLAQALGKYEHVFGDFFVNLVKVGETSGNLSETLLHLSAELK
ncbi:MAG TPA: type II secretion system F family protein, partial [Candidatus Paceibacterota bacterium]|nr:type II secretion system F family protein [Candidatus Paceibacterota bacterium]